MSPPLLQQASVSEALDRTTFALRTAGIPTARLESYALLEHVLDQSRAWLLAHPGPPMSPEQIERLEQLVERRLRGEPLAYLVQHREFFDLDFYVDDRVLIPRPESELLVERAIGRVQRHQGKSTIVDVGTGSGAIALALARHLPQTRVLAVDRSAAALEVACLNAMHLDLKHRVHFVHGDLLAWLREPVDVIVANLPYIPSDRLAALPVDVRDFEPRLALDGGRAGLEPMKRLIRQAERRLADRGTLLLECDPDQIAPLTETAFQALPRCSVTSIKDSFGHERVLEISSS